VLLVDLKSSKTNEAQMNSTDYHKFRPALETEGWLSPGVMFLFKDLLLSAPKDGHILEIGAWKGRSTKTFALCKNPNQVIHSIDPFTGSQEHHHLETKNVNTFNEFKENLKVELAQKHVIPLVGTSYEIPEIKVKVPLSLLFIDGSHEFGDVLLDFNKWSPLVQPGGFIAFHDYKWPGVRETIWEYACTDPNLGRPRRVEDTVVFKVLKNPRALDAFMKNLWLTGEKSKQFLKRKKRRLRKKIKKTLFKLSPTHPNK
jgi:predicted O-methyltransferase YrrM